MERGAANLITTTPVPDPLSYFAPTKPFQHRGLHGQSLRQRQRRNRLLQKAALPLDSAGRAGAQHTAALTGRSPVCRASQPHQRGGGGRGSDRVGRQGTEAGTQIRYRDLLCFIFFNCSRERDVTFREEKGKNLTNTTAQTHTELDTSPHVPTWS